MKYNFEYEYGIDDLKEEYAFVGNSQGDESATNSIESYKDSEGWLSYTFENVPLNQKAINKEVLKRKEYNKNYIQKLKDSGKYGKKYKVSIQIEDDMLYDEKVNTIETESYRIDILNLNNINLK